MNCTKKAIFPGSVIGIIGGGQLAKMLSISAKTLGYKTIVLDPSPFCCSRSVCDEFLEYQYNDEKALKKLAEKTDIITYEFENIPYSSINWINECGGYVPQDYEVLAISQDRLLEKQKLEQSGFFVAPYKEINNIIDLKNSTEELGFPCVLKTRSGGYDGKGQFLLKSKDDINEASELLKSPCILEKKINFDSELSVIAIKSISGEIDIFPIGENIHKKGILQTTYHPFEIEINLKNELEVAIKNFYERYDVVGILTIELFLVEDKIIANEIAPRPHNSGHWTLDGSNISQFEQHIRGICNLPLVKSEVIKPTAMINLLGQHYEKLIENIDEIGKISKIHIYGKDKNVYNRKVGHLNIIEKNKEDLKIIVEKILQKLEG